MHQSSLLDLVKYFWHVQEDGTGVHVPVEIVAAQQQKLEPLLKAVVGVLDGYSRSEYNKKLKSYARHALGQ